MDLARSQKSQKNHEKSITVRYAREFITGPGTVSYDNIM